MEKAHSFVWKNKGWTSVRHNGNRTEWSPIWSVIIRVINKIWRLTELDDTKSCYQLIITVHNFRKKKHLGQTTALDTMSNVKNFLQFIAMLIVITTVIGGFSWVDLVCFLQLSDYSKLSNYNWTEWLVKNKAANAPFIFEEIVMVIKIHSENGTLLSSCNDCSTKKTRRSAFWSLNR